MLDVRYWIFGIWNWEPGIKIRLGKNLTQRRRGHQENNSYNTFEQHTIKISPINIPAAEVERAIIADSGQALDEYDALLAEILNVREISNENKIIKQTNSIYYLYRTC